MARFDQNDYSEEEVTSVDRERVLVWRLLGYLKPYRFPLGCAFLFLLISRFIEAGLPIYIGYISQKILSSDVLDTLQKSRMVSPIMWDCLLVIGLYILSYLFDSTNVILRSWTGQKALYHFRMQIYEHILRMPLSYFDKQSIGRLMTRTIHDIDQINLMFAESVVPIVGSIFLFGGIFIGLVIIDWKIAVLALFITPFAWWFTRRFRLMEKKAYDRLRTVISGMNTFVQEHLMGFSTVRNFGLQAQAKKRFNEINYDECNANMECFKHFCLFITAIEFMQNFALIFAFTVIVAYASGYVEFQAGTFFTFTLYVAMFFRPLADLAERYNLLQAAMAAATRIFSVLDAPSELSKDQGKLELKEVKTILLEDVWFAYEKEDWVLKGLNMSLKTGESCAIVGMTGEGKSTIMSLLLRFYEPQKGSIKINGINIQSYTLDSLRSQFCMVLQDPVLFSGSIADNISLFNPSIAKSSIEDAINYLGITKIVDRFPEGIASLLKEQGKSLSAGEKQLISLARAVCYNRPVLILDEATANIDEVTEQILQEALKKVLTHSTAIVVAHRLSTIKDVSRIFVLQNGRIAEEGTHTALLAKKGVYENLYRLQFS